MFNFLLPSVSTQLCHLDNIWPKTFGVIDEKHEFTAFDISNDNILVAGRNTDNPIAYLLCFTSDGDLVWKKKYIDH